MRRTLQETLAVIAILALVLMGGLSSFQCGEAAHAQEKDRSVTDFLPLSEDAGERGTFLGLLQLRDLSDTAAALRTGAMGLFSLVEEEVASEDRMDMLQVQDILSAAVDDLSLFGEALFGLSGALSEDVSSEFLGALTLKRGGEDEALAFLREISEDFGAREDAEFHFCTFQLNDQGEGRLKPLYRIDNGDDSLLYTACYDRGGAAYLLVGSSIGSLRRMRTAAESGEARLVMNRHVEGANYLRFSLDLSSFEKEMAEVGYPLRNESILDMEFAFRQKDDVFEVEGFNNVSRVFMTAEERAAGRPLERIPGFVGDGTVLAVVAGRMEGLADGLTPESLAELVSAERKDVDDALSSLWENYGITLDDIKDLMRGRFAIVLGGRAISSIGDVPGLYLLLEDLRPGVAEKFAAIVRDLRESLPFSRKEVEGWRAVWGLDHLVSATVAAGETSLLAGILDYRAISTSSRIPANIISSLVGDGYGTLAISLRDLDGVLQNLARRMNMLLQDSKVEAVADGVHTVLSNLDALTIRSTDLDRFILRLTTRSKGATSVEEI